MALDNSLHEYLKMLYFKINDYLETTKLERAHSAMIVKHEELAELLETFDIEAIEEQRSDIETLHAELRDIKDVAREVMFDLGPGSETPLKVANGLDTIFSKINAIKV